MYGGNIVRNASTTNGGGVWVKPKGKFEMYRGSISGNTAYGNGGGVYNTGMFDMYGGTISDNNAQGQGDGVYNTNIFNMYGGTISSTGVAIENTGTMTISGGTVSGSQGIRNVDNGTVKLSGNPTISSNSGAIDIECYSTNEGQIDADGYTGKPLKIAIGGATAGQDNFDLMLNKVIVKNTTADKFILVDSTGNTYTDYALVQEGNDLVLHEHSYTYSVSGNIVTESCTCGHEKKATLSAPTGELVYNGNSFNASIAYDTGWVGEQPTEISYTKNTAATSDTTGAGNYIASITIENKIASVAYKIEKATPTDVSWPTGLKGIAGNPLNTIKLSDGFTWITPNRVMDYNMMDADIRYQPNANYNPVEKSVNIEVVDDKDPTGTISIGDKNWSSFVDKENISFDVFFNEKQTVTITVDDGEYGSGVDYDEFGYYISTKKKSINELSNMTYDTWKEYTGAFEIKPNRECIIYVRFQDYAHRMTYLSSDGIVLDSIAPTISGIENGKTYCGAVEVTVSDTYLDRVEIGGVKATVTDGKFTISPAVGAQEIIAYDKAGNTTTYTITVNNGHICTYDESTEDTIVEKCQYCDFSASAQIKAPAGELVYNGNANDASIVYTGTLSGGNNLVISYGDATNTINAGKYTATITFGGKTAKVNYEVKKADYTNITWPTKLSGNVGDKVSSIVLENGFVWNNPNEIIEYEKKDYAIRYELDRKNYNSVTRLISVKAIDNVAPKGEISIGTNHWNTFLNTITFGLFFKETQTVTITVNDNEYGSGVEEVYYYLATEEKSVNELTNMALSSWVKDVFEFNINPNRKYIIYVRILDAASNEAFISSEGIVVDNEAPVISGITDGATYCGDVEATVTDAYLDRVTVGGIETTVTNGKFTVSHTNGTQEIKAYDKAGNVTTYTITFDNNHTYSYDESTADTIVEKCQRCNYSASAQIKKPTGELVYNGSAHNATVVYTGTLYGGNNLSISYGTATDTIGAGDYTASITLGGKTASVSYTVEKQKVTPPTIDSKVYTGETLTADVSETAFYTVTTNLGGKNVAAYDVVLTLKDGNNYKWDATEGVDGDKITLKFNITKATNEWTENPAMAGWTYGETVKSPTGKAKFIEGDYGIAYYDKDKNPIGNPSDAGEYYAEIFVTPTDNFTGLSSGYLSFTIKKADLTITAKDHSITYGDAPSNNGVTYSGFVNGETKTVLIGTLGFEYSYAQYGDIGDNFTITPKGLTAANYEITFVPGKLTVKPLMIEFDWKTLSPEDLVYDGNDKKIGTTVTNKVTSGQYDLWLLVEYHGDTKNVTEEGFYAQIKGPGGEKAHNYNVDDTAKSPVYRITKATPETNFPTGFNIDTGKKLSDIDLTGFDGYTWDAPDTSVEYDVHEYSMTFTPADTQNYMTVSKMIKVTGGDITAPTGEITLKDNKWNEFLNNITFGLFFKETQSITITAADTESGVKEIAYYLATEELSKDQLDALQSADWTIDDEFNINPENKYIIYAKITDNAGNVTYLSTNGIVLFKDTEITTGEYEYTLTTKTDIVTNIKPGSNTVNMIDICEPGGGAGDMLDYFINSDGYIVLKGESLEGFTKDWYAGDYTVTVMYNALGEEYVDGTSKGDKINDTVITLTVKRFKAEKPTADSTVFTYNSSEQTYNIPESECYTVSGNKRTNAGEQDVTVALKDTNTFEWADGTTDNLTFKFNIGKADPTVTWPNALVGNAGDKLSTVALESGFTWDNADTVIVYSDNNYGMTYTPADTANYNILKKDIKVNGLDVTFPMGEITLKDNKWNEFLNNITFGTFFKDTQTVTVTTSDTESGIAKTEYYLATAETDDFGNVQWTEFEGSFDISQNSKCVVYVKLTDNAGNITYINSNGIVLDSIKPVISGVEDGKDVYGDATFTVDEEYLDTVTLDGKPIEVKDGKYSVPADNKEHTVVVTDKTGNQVTYKLTVYKNYKVSFVVDGKEIEASEVGYGKDAALPEIPSKDGYTAIWNVDGKNITADTVITAVYEKIPEVPNTGDNSNIWLWVAILFVSGISVFGISAKKRKENQA